MPDLAQRSATELAAALQRREIGSRELLDRYLDRVERLTPALNAVVALAADAARARADEADAALARGESWGPLHGLPITIKDAIEVAGGMPTTSGAPELKDHRPAQSAASAQRLIDAGAVVFGKTNLPLYAGDLQSYNAVYGTTNNPWDASRTPGGSSGGSAAAIAAGLAGLELGSDIGGSIRTPAHFTGVYGHKPSYGVVSGRGHVPGPPGQIARDDIAVIGPLGRSADDLELALDLLAGPNAEDAAAWRVDLPAPRRGRLTDFRVAAWLDDPQCPVGAAVAERLHAAVDAVAAAGAKVDVGARPEVDTAASHELYLRLLYGVLGAGFPDAVRARFEAQAKQLDPNDRGVGASMIRGTTQSHREWLVANEARQRLRTRWADFFRDWDVLLCPVTPTPAIPHDHSDIATRTVEIDGKSHPYFVQVFWAGLTGVVYLPATSAPIGRTPEGLPVGIQNVAPYLEDRTAIRFAKLLGDVIGGYEPPPGFE